MALRKFMIERDIPKVGTFEREQLRGAAAKSNGVLRQLGPDIQWLESYVADNKTFCVYLAKDEDIIRKHAEISGFPATKITEVRKMIDPTTERPDPAAIVLTGTPAALALKRQTTTIPIVLAPIADPIALGLARSLARPGGNVTGLTMFGPELAHKRMEIFREAAAGIRRVAVLVNAENPLHPFLWDDIQPIGPLLGLELSRLSVSDFNQLPTMFSTMARDGFNALTLFSDAQFFSARRRIAELAAMHRLPAMYESRDFVDDGGLISYGPNVPDLSRRAAAYVVKILNGAKASELPIEQPTRFELVVNLKTAKALG